VERSRWRLSRGYAVSTVPLSLGTRTVGIEGSVGLGEPTTEAQREVRTWTISKPSSRDMDFLRSYQATVELKLDETHRFLCFQGSPTSYGAVLLSDTPNEDWEKALGTYSPAIMAGGHTHTQQLRRVGEGLFFNPGSIGIVYDLLLPNDIFHVDP
jgi:hypothetical protein